MDLADATGGSKNSICNSFDTILNNISSGIANQIKAQFFLTPSNFDTSVYFRGTTIFPSLSRNPFKSWARHLDQHLIKPIQMLVSR